MLSAYMVLSWLCTLGVVVHARRRSEEAWLSIDRSRAGWLGYVIPAGLFGLGPFCLVAYWLGVAQHFPAAASAGATWHPPGSSPLPPSPGACESCRTPLDPNGRFCGACGRPHAVGETESTASGSSP
jgi:hypothetical protein